MKNSVLFALILILAAVEAGAQAPQWLWANSAGGSNYDYAFGCAADAAGNIYVTGSFQSDSVSIGPVTLTNTSIYSDIFIAKYDGNGTVLWAKSVEGLSEDHGITAAVDAGGNVYIAGYFYSDTIAFDSVLLVNSYPGFTDAFIAKYDSNGTIQWAGSAGGADNDKALGISVDGAGNVYICGAFVSDTIAFGTTLLVNAGPGNADLF